VHLPQIKSLVAHLDVEHGLPASHKQPGFHSNIESLRLYWSLHADIPHHPGDVLYLLSLTRRLKKLVLSESSQLDPVLKIKDVATALNLSRQTLQALEFDQSYDKPKPITRFDPKIFRPFAALRSLKLSCAPALHTSKGIAPFLPGLRSLVLTTPVRLTGDELLLLIRSRPPALRQLKSAVDLYHKDLRLLLEVQSIGITKYHLSGRQLPFITASFGDVASPDE